MKKYALIISLFLLLTLQGCEGTANNNVVADIFIGQELLMFFLFMLMIVLSIIGITSEKGLLFYAKMIRRKRWNYYHEVTNADLTMAAITVWIQLIIGILGFLFASYYLFIY